MRGSSIQAWNEKIFRGASSACDKHARAIDGIKAGERGFADTKQRVRLLAGGVLNINGHLNARQVALTDVIEHKSSAESIAREHNVLREFEADLRADSCRAAGSSDRQGRQTTTAGWRC